MCVKELTVDELHRCFEYHYERFLDTHPKAKGAGRPSSDTAMRNWLLQQIKAEHQGKKNLDPYNRTCNDDVRAHFGLASNKDIVSACSKLSYPKQPSVHEMWVNNPERRTTSWSNNKSKVGHGGMSWQ